MLSQVKPEQYGCKELSQTDELDILINERQDTTKEIIRQQDLRNESDKKIDNLTRRYYNEVIGTKHRLKYIKNGQLRFYERKNV